MLTFDQVVLSGADRRTTFAGLSLQIGLRRALLIAERDDITAGFVNLVIGSRRPASGKVGLTGRPSWPIGQPMFRSALTGRETVLFLADLYNLDGRACMKDAVRWFGAAQMGKPLNAWPSAERVKFERLAALWPEFDVYIVHGAAPTKDPAFESEWLARFQERLAGRGLLAIGPPLEPWSELCDITILLRPDEAVCYNKITDALLDVKPTEAGELMEESKRNLNDDDEFF